MKDKSDVKQQKFFDKDEKTKEKIRKYEKNEPLYDDDYIEKQLQEELLREREDSSPKVGSTK